MNEDFILITGANGEVGHGLIQHLAKVGHKQIIAFSRSPLSEELRPLVSNPMAMDVQNLEGLTKLFENYNITTVYHLASILSTKGEHNPVMAHSINVNGTMNLLDLSVRQMERTGRAVKFIYPSSIAVHAIPNLEVKAKAGKLKENDYVQSTTMYGINKLYCENLGRYFNSHFKQLSFAPDERPYVDFRAVRFPGLISADTMPTGGTSDYGPEMIHAAASNKHYNCFVCPDSTLPFMVMPDAIKSLVLLHAADRERLTQTVYNVTSFSPTAQEIYDVTKEAFPNADIDFVPDVNRQGIVDSWPADIDDSTARADWDWQPDYDFKRAFNEYLIPAIRRRYDN